VPDECVQVRWSVQDYLTTQLAVAPAASGIAVTTQTSTISALQVEINALLAQIADLQARLTAAAETIH
jgi:hypothetical protein